jgi:hypothetical protein
MLLGLAAATGAIAASSCGDENDSPVRIAGSKPDGGVPNDAGPDGSTDGGPVVRTVMQRNPYGNVAETENLLWDGDFEWASPFSDEYGWFPFPLSQQAVPPILVGPDCRSGLKCAVLKHNKGAIGIGVASKGSKLEASFWTKPASGADCTSFRAVLLSVPSLLAAAQTLLGQPDPDNEVAPESPAPGPDGWCHFDAVVAERTQRIFLYVYNSANGEALLDDAVVKRAPANKALSALVGPPSDERVKELDAVRAAARTHSLPSDPPPNTARRAFEAWARRGALP